MGGAHAVGEQFLVDAVVAGAHERRAAGQLRQLFAHQALFIEAVAQALVRHGRVDGDLVEQVVAAGPLILSGELGAGLEQVVARRIRVLNEQTALRAFKSV